ncbi:MAG TPA: NAD(+) synthase [Xanthomonadales bacterium]|nr:NAD(+) synthase [Xanthomonadales bacterium]
MKNFYLKINPADEKHKIISFLRKTFEKQNIDKAVIGLSGGIDSMVSFYLLKEVLPLKNVFVSHLYYDSSKFAEIKKVLDRLEFPKQNIYLLPIKSPVDELSKILGIIDGPADKIRKGNIMARVRMITLFDRAKKNNALVCGTENKSENLLGYFTRFGDQASDIEPISHLYKTQVYQLAKSLGVPNEIIEQAPSAGLWADQTDEGEFGFTYEEADPVLCLTLEKNMSIKEIEKKGFKNVKKILAFREKNLFKHQTPYQL